MPVAASTLPAASEGGTVPVRCLNSYARRLRTMPFRLSAICLFAAASCGPLQLPLPYAPTLPMPFL
eukprot:5198215-Prymnesium_polylepis.1